MVGRRRGVVVSVLVVGLLPATMSSAAATDPLPAPTVSPSTLVAGQTLATISGTGCTAPTAGAVTSVDVLVLDAADHPVAHRTTTPAADGTWSTTFTPAVDTAAGNLQVSADCDVAGGGQTPYASATFAVTASTAAPWTRQSPGLPRIANGRLVDVGCVSSTACVAVGSFSTADGPKPLVENWVGKKWSLDPAPPTVGTDVVSLAGIDCPSSGTCVAVGETVSPDSLHHALVATRTGSSWTTQVLPAANGEATLTDVSCATATSCVAIGSTGEISDPSGGVHRPTAYRWNGTTWTLTGASVAAGGRYTAVSCATVTACAATTSDDLGTTATLELLSGVRWRAGTLADTGTAATRLDGISCPTAATCVAVGSIGGPGSSATALVETSSGGVWSRAATADTSGGALEDVDCFSGSRCTAVGTDDSGTLVLASGATWTRPSGTSSSAHPYAVACAASNVCLIVGDQGSELVTWGVVLRTSGGFDPRSDYPRDGIGFLSGGFSGVSCPAVDACSAVGYSQDHFTSPDPLPFIDHWDGTSWSVQELPYLYAPYELDAITCPDPTSCVAVGTIANASTHLANPLALGWQGGAWFRFKLGQGVGNLPGRLNAVSCTDRTSCLAVGNTMDSGGNPFAFALSAGSWARVAKPPVDDTSVRLLDVSCAPGAAVGCRVVGSASSATGPAHGVDLGWDGSVWTTGPTVAPSSSVDCPTTTTCLATTIPTAGTAVPLTVSRFDGATWTTEKLPDPAYGYDTALNGVACRVGLSCVVVGNAGNAGDRGYYVARRSPTAVWRQRAVTPNTGSDDTLTSVSCPSDDVCVAVGVDQRRQPVIAVSPQP